MTTPPTKGTAPAAKPDPGHDDDFIVAPPGRSKAFYIFVLVLMLFVLIVFSIGDLVQFTLGGGGAEPGSQTFASWTDPISDQRVEIDGNEYQRGLLDLQNAQGMNLWTPLVVFAEDYVPPTRRAPDFEVEDVLAYLFCERLALQTRVAISDREFQDTASLYLTEDYIALIGRNTRRSKRDVVDAIKRVMRASKMRRVMIEAVTLASDPDTVAERWQEENPEYRFEYVETKVADWIDVAKESAPPDVDLQTWYDALPAAEKRQFFSPATMKIKVAYVPMPSMEDVTFDATALLEAYPPAETVDLNSAQELYYTIARAARFEKDAPEGAEPPEVPEYHAIEDVRAQVDAEAAIYGAMGEFLKDVRARTAEWDAADPEPTEPRPDWFAEASALGLVIEEPTGFLTAEDITEGDHAWRGATLASRLSFSAPNALVPNVHVHDGALVIAYLDERVNPAEQDLQLIKQDVLDAWAEEEAQRLAVQRLNLLRELVADRPEGPNGVPVPHAEWTPVVAEADLAQGATTLDLTLSQRDWRGKRPLTADEASDFDRVLQAKPSYFEDLEVGALPEPGLDLTEEAAYLVHLVETREAPLANMLPVELMAARRNQANEDFIAFLRDILNPRGEWFQTTYELVVPSWDEEAEEAENGAEGSAGQGATGGAGTGGADTGGADTGGADTGGGDTAGGDTEEG